MAANREDKHLSSLLFPSLLPFEAASTDDMVTNNQSVDDFPILISDWHSARAASRLRSLSGIRSGKTSSEHSIISRGEIYSAAESRALIEMVFHVQK